MMNADQEVAVMLTAAECNTLLAVLGEVPYRIAAPIVAKLHSHLLAVDPTAFDRPPAANGSAAHASD
jgi:hypothetical protein